MERAVQHLYPLELACDTSCDVMPEREDSNEVNHDVENKRPRRNTSAIAKVRVQDVTEYENKTPAVE